MEQRGFKRLIVNQESGHVNQLLQGSGHVNQLLQGSGHVNLLLQGSGHVNQLLQGSGYTACKVLSLTIATMPEGPWSHKISQLHQAKQCAHFRMGQCT